MTTKTNIPTDAELKEQLKEARDSLHLVRVAVAEGTADAKQLAEAEQAEHFARTRLEAAEEARQERLRRQDHERAIEIVSELQDLQPLIAKQREREETIREMVTEYLDTANEIRAEVAGAYWEVSAMRDRDKTILHDHGIRITSASTSVHIGDTTYGAPDGTAFLRELEREAGNRGGRLSAPPKTAQRPSRRKKG